MPPDLQFLLGEMNAKIDTLLRRTDEDRKASQADIEKLETRIEELERWRWKIVGAATVLGSAGGYLVHLLTS